MHNAVDIDQLLAATRALNVTFDNIPTAPVIINKANNIGLPAKRQIIDRYLLHSFVIVQLTNDFPTAEALSALAISLDLGVPFVPPLYGKGDYTTTAISQISSQGYQGSNHPSFEQTSGIEFHCDGTLQKIGYVKTSILLCESAGAEGGDSTLFNALGAFAKLAETDLPAAVALASPGVLVRQANINGCSDINEGPAFTVLDGELICAYSVTKTDSLIATEGVDVLALRRGSNFLRQAALPGSPFFTQLRLEAGQAIILSNSKICHGRTPFTDNSDQKRCLYRGLYLNRPKMAADSLLAIAS